MGYTLSKQPLSKEIFRDDYIRKIWSGGEFGARDPFRNNIHKGVDYGADVGEKLYPLEKSEIMFITSANTQLEKDFGKFVGMYLLDYDVTITYAHDNSVVVSKGQIVEKVQPVATSGNTGKSKGPHVDVMCAKGKHTSLKSVYDNAINFETLKLVKNEQKGGFVAQHGLFTATDKLGSNIRKEPSMSSQRVGGLPKGDSIEYSGYVDNDGIRWVKTDKGYIARKTLDNKTEFGKAEFIQPLKKTFINLLPHVSKYAIYKADTPIDKVNRPNNIGDLFPSKFGGLSYECEKVPGSKNVYYIHTRDFGKVKIAQVDGLSTITNERVYKVV